MKKMLYISPLGIEDEASGLSKKINNQIEYFKKNDIRVELYNIKRKSSFYNKVWTRMPLTGVYAWPFSIPKEKLVDFDYIYIRYHASDHQLIRFLRKAKKNNSKIKIIVEIPTYPYGDENSSKIKRGIHVNKDVKYREHLKKWVDFIVTFSKDNCIFGVPTIRISNTVDFDKIKIKKTRVNNLSLDLIAVGSLYFWHGYDRVIEGLNHYYNAVENKGELMTVKLHLVGGGPELKKYQSLVDEYNLKEYVQLYGPLKGKELDVVYDKADIALDSLGRHRSKVYFNSSLKGKEYGAKGLPIISGVETELDQFDDFIYYKRVSADDSPIDIKEVIEYKKELLKEATPNEYSVLIRKFNKRTFSSKQSWGKVVEKLKGN